MDASPPAAIPAATMAAMPGAESRQRMRDGTELLVRTWLPDPARWPDPRGTLLLVHGMSEHSGRYLHVIGQLCDLGLRVRAFDLRGHGRSGGARMVAPRPDCFHEDLVEIYDATVQQWPELPIVFGHSLGGLVAARLATARTRPIRALVLSSPALGLHLPAAGMALHRVLLTLAPDLRVPSPVRPADLSHDANEVARYRADPLVQRTVTAGLLQSVIDGIARVQEDAPLLEAPTLLIAASADRVVDPAGSRRFCDNAPSDLCESAWIDGAFHEVFHETQTLRVQAFDALTGWLRGHLEPAGGPASA
ncbi:lysophospholipase [Cupriavidus gilardii J11]|uniref:Lysophospholipase n=1 Tax=Cupriavidus gilardii J11 TaxID=936133 RepID=A0A562BSC3_9BURK|nr:alpha/beta hydrolase [Cupriavidus gilardii]TWG88101.1 lysophospholipase [Cupriavidus gilardii J11]